MSIKNCQAIQKSSIDRKSNTWFTLGSWFVTLTIFLGRLPVAVFKSLNDRQSDIFLKFKESKVPIPTQAIQKSFIDHKSNKRLVYARLRELDHGLWHFNFF